MFKISNTKETCKMYRFDLNTVVYYLICLHIVKGHNRNDTAPSTAMCRSEKDCVVLKDCQPYMDFINKLEKPLKPTVVDFLRAEQCGIQDGHPKICCSGVIKVQPAIDRATSIGSVHAKCSMHSKCVHLRDCTSYMNFVRAVEKPLSDNVVQFLRSQQCGFQKGQPLICCSILPKSLYLLKHANPEIRPHRKRGNRFLHLGDSQHLIIEYSTPQMKTSEFLPGSGDSKPINGDQPTVADVDKHNIDKHQVLKEKAEAINVAFSNLFDLNEAYDLFRRKRSSDGHNLLDIEIR